MPAAIVPAAASLDADQWSDSSSRNPPARAPATSFAAAVTPLALGCSAPPTFARSARRAAPAPALRFATSRRGDAPPVRSMHRAPPASAALLSLGQIAP